MREDHDALPVDIMERIAGEERRELKRLLNEANTRIEMMSEPKVAPKAHSEFCECNTCTVMRVNSKLWDQIHEMDARIAVYRDCLEFVAYHGTSRPPAMGEGNDGDEWYKDICHKMISRCAIALKELEKP